MTSSSKAKFDSEVDLVTTYIRAIGPRTAEEWTAYHETAGWDLLMVRKHDGAQIGIEAKLQFNPAVLSQCIGRGDRYNYTGPDYRAVLVPEGGLQLHMTSIAVALGVVVIQVQRRQTMGRVFYRGEPSLPKEDDSWSTRDWPQWCPEHRHKLPDYIPDVIGGSSAPVQLTDWKIRAIRLLILLDRQGSVKRADLHAIGISPTLWTVRGHGYLSPSEQGYIRNERTPDLKAQHPRAWADIEADWGEWGPRIQTAAALVRGRGKR